MDLEKQHGDVDHHVHEVSSQPSLIPGEDDKARPVDRPNGTYARAVDRLIHNEKFERKSIERISPEERHPATWLADAQMFFLWMSANVTLNNLAVAILGPFFFQLGWNDCVMCVVLGTVIGALSCAYMSIWGARSGLRTMVVMRYFMGYWPAKIPAILNVVLMLGYCTIDAIVAGQVLSAVSGSQNMSIAVGIVIVSVVVLFIGIVGMRIFHAYERFAWIPQLIVLCILIGVSHKNYDTTLTSVGNTATINANRLSFLSIIFYVPNSWAGAASDFYVYYPEKTNRVKIFFLTWLGLTVAFLFVNMIGVALGTGLLNNTDWANAYDISSGALITEAFSPLGNFGKFCAVVVAFSSIANSVPGTYAASLDLQTCGHYALKVPRWVWILVQVIIQLACGIAGRNQLLIIFTNFLALMGYWLTICIVIVLLEHVVFQRCHVDFDWSNWDKRRRLPTGIAAFITFLIGWVGAVVGMNQVYFIGPLARMVGDDGADLGVWLATGLTVIAYPILRFAEIKLGWSRQP